MNLKVPRVTSPADRESGAAGTGTPRHLQWSAVADKGFVPAVLVVLLLYLSLASPYFLTAQNAKNILFQASVLGIAAVGTTFVIICGELDLSIGANIALSGVVASMGMTSVSHNDVTVGVLLGVATGVAVGVVNGIVTTVFRVPSFISTLGMLVIATGLALQLTSGSTVAGLPSSFGNLSNYPVLGLRLLVWIMFACFILGYLALHRTSFGLRVFAVGDNNEAARLAGLRTNLVRFAAFTISGLSGGVGGVLLAAQVLAGQPNVGTTLTLYATAAVILGGTSIRGGQGSMIRTTLGVLLIGVVQNGLNILGVAYAFQEVAVGVVFIFAASAELLHRARMR